MTGGHGKHPQPEPKESNTMEGVPSRSVYGAEHTVTMPREEGIDVPQLVVPMTKEDERHMRQDLHRDPAEILQRSLHDTEARQQREASLRAAAPGNNLEEMAAGVTGRQSPGRRAAATTPPDYEHDKLREVTARDAPEAQLFTNEPPEPEKLDVVGAVERDPNARVRQGEGTGRGVQVQVPQ